MAKVTWGPNEAAVKITGVGRDRTALPRELPGSPRKVRLHSSWVLRGRKSGGAVSEVGSLAGKFATGLIMIGGGYDRVVMLRLYSLLNTWSRQPTRAARAMPANSASRTRRFTLNVLTIRGVFPFLDRSGAGAIHAQDGRPLLLRLPLDHSFHLTLQVVTDAECLTHSWPISLYGRLVPAWRTLPRSGEKRGVGLSWPTPPGKYCLCLVAAVVRIEHVLSIRDELRSSGVSTAITRLGSYHGIEEVRPAANRVRPAPQSATDIDAFIEE